MGSCLPICILLKRQSLTVSSLAFQTPLCPLPVLITFLFDLSCVSMITVIVLWKPSWKEQGMIHSLCDSSSYSFISIAMTTAYRVVSWRSAGCCQYMVILIDVMLWTQKYVLIIQQSQMCAVQVSNHLVFVVVYIWPSFDLSTLFCSFQLVSSILLSSGSVHGICRYWWSLLRGEDPLCRRGLLAYGQI